MVKTIKTEKIPLKLWLDDIDEKTLNQAKNLANLPHAFKWIAIMPDAHPGYGMPIGGVLATVGTVVPNAVGVDIGCGMMAVKTSLSKIETETLKTILGMIRETIPVGFQHQEGKMEWEGFAKAPNIEIIQNELENAKTQIGTLGGGNHFIEILKGDDGSIWLMVHSGSRNFGFKTAGFFYEKAKAFCLEKGVNLPTFELSFLPLGEGIGERYLAAMNFCLEFALANRNLMMARIREIFGKETGCGFSPAIDSHHNYASLETHFGKEVCVHRKGAIKATHGLIGIIPGSMGAPSYIVEGLGNKESFTSCSHGAGRKLGRKEAIRSLSLEKETEKMRGILGAPRTKNELQEAPGTYKDILKVMENQKDLVKIKVKLNPLAVVTGN